MTPALAAAKLGRVAAALPREIVKAEAQTLKEAQAQAVKLSSGPLSSATLARMGHPYARRNPTSPNPQVINARTGLLRSSWVTAGPSQGTGGIVSRVYNTSPEARYMLGTRLMIPRPIQQAVAAAVAPKRRSRLMKAVRDSWRS